MSGVERRRGIPSGMGDQGRPLDATTKRRAEATTGQSVDGVQVHDDSHSQRWVDGLGALGATVGQDVALGSQARGGLLREAVLAHEVAHAAQASENQASHLDVSGFHDAAAEAHADRTAAGMLTGERVPTRADSRALALRRCDDPPAKVKEAAKGADPAKLSGFEKMVKGGVPAADAAATMQLPKELMDALTEAWKNSFPGGRSKEQGGLLVRKADGTLDWIAATQSTSGSTRLPMDKVPAGGTALSGAHTHPYDASEGGHRGVSFSGDDLANLVTQPVPTKVVHAGDRYFVVAMTQEFEALVAKAPDKAQLREKIKSEWTALYSGGSGDIPARAGAATKAICKSYQLILYEGDLKGEVKKVAL